MTTRPNPPRTQTVDEQIQAMLGKAKAQEEAQDAKDEEQLPESEPAPDGEEGELESDEVEEESDGEEDEQDADEVEEEEAAEEEEEAEEEAEEDEEAADEEEEEEEEGEEEEAAESQSELERLRRENDALKRTLDARSDTTPLPEQPKDDTPESLDVKPIDLVDDETYDKALESREVLNDLLNKVRKNAIEFTYEAVLKRLPQVVQRQVSHESAQQKMVDDFFRANEDLLPVRRYVALEFQTLIAKNPDMSYPDLLAETAAIVRKSLGMTRTAGRKAKPNKARRRPPSTPDGSRSRQQPRRPSGIAAEIAAMAQVR